MSTPGTLNITLYYNGSHGLVIQFKDSNGDDFDISSYTDFLMRIYPVSNRSQIGSDIELTRTGSQLDHTFSVEDIQGYPSNMRHEILFKNGADVDPVLRGDLKVTDVLKDDTVSTSAEVTLTDDVNVVTVSDVTIVNELGSISSQTAKTTPADTDVFVGQESDNSLFKVTWANIKATLKTYFDTLYQSILSEGAFVDGDKTKLDGIESGAEVNDVDSVAGKTGAVSLDFNDLSDTTITDGAENDLLTLESGVWVNTSVVNAIHPVVSSLKVRSDYTPSLIQRNGTVIQGPSTLQDFTDPIDGLLYKKWTGFTADTDNTSSFHVFRCNGFIRTGGSPDYGLILGVDDSNYFECKWGRFPNFLIRRIENDTVVYTDSGDIGQLNRGMPFSIEIKLGGGGRTTVSMQGNAGATDEVIFQDITDYRTPITYFATRLVDENTDFISIGNKFSVT